MTRPSLRVLYVAALAALALSSCASPFGPSSAVPAAVPAAQRPPSELPNRVMIPAVAMGAPSGAAQPVTATPIATSAAAIATATPAPKQAEPVSSFRFCAHRADFKPAAPNCPEGATAFASGVTRINGVWTVAAWPGASLSGRWYLNGKGLADAAGAKTRSLCWDGKPEALGFTRSGPQFIALAAAALGTPNLGQGAYRFELYADGKLILAAGFGVGAFDPAMIAAAPTGGVAQPCPR